MFTVATYGIYLTISTLLTIWVARVLFKNGQIFLVDAFQGNNELAQSVNHLLVVGFYLINMGWVMATSQVTNDPQNWGQVLYFVTGQLGTVLLTLGFMHFFNLFVLSRIRKRTRKAHKPQWESAPPVSPQGFMPPFLPPTQESTHATEPAFATALPNTGGHS